MEEQWTWLVVFFSVVFVGTIVIFLNPLGIDGIIRDGYRLLSIFLGMLAGIALGEVFKIRSNGKTGRVLLDDLLEELRVNSELLERNVPLRKGFWILGIRSGRAEFIPRRERRTLWEIYSRITHYNEDLGFLHRKMITEGRESLLPEMREEIDRFKGEIGGRIQDFLQIYPEQE